MYWRLDWNLKPSTTKTFFRWRFNAGLQHHVSVIVCVVWVWVDIVLSRHFWDTTSIFVICFFFLIIKMLKRLKESRNKSKIRFRFTFIFSNYFPINKVNCVQFYLPCLNNWSFGFMLKNEIATQIICLSHHITIIQCNMSFKIHIFFFIYVV